MIKVKSKSCLFLKNMTFGTSLNEGFQGVHRKGSKRNQNWVYVTRAKIQQQCDVIWRANFVATKFYPLIFRKAVCFSKKFSKTVYIKNWIKMLFFFLPGCCPKMLYRNYAAVKKPISLR